MKSAHYQVVSRDTKSRDYLAAHFCVIVFVFFAHGMWAQERPLVGVFGSFGLNNHRADFQRLPGVPNCCPRFESGVGWGPSLGILVERPITDRFVGQGRIVYQNLGGLLTKKEPTWVIVDGIGREGNFVHELDARIATLGAELGLGYRLSNAFAIRLGLNVSSVLQAEYSQRELIDPDQPFGTFADSLGNDTRQRIRNQFSGDIVGASSWAVFGLIAASYDLKLNAQETIFLSPELSLNYGFSNMTPELQWTVSAYRAGLALKYRPPVKPERQKREELIEQIDTIRVIARAGTIPGFYQGTERVARSTREETDTDVTVVVRSRTDTVVSPRPSRLASSLKGRDRQGNIIAEPSIRIEEFASILMTPLLNYVFFDDGQAVIPEKYRRLSPIDRGTFDEKKVNSEDRLAVYYHVLNIIGARMQSRPRARLQIVGCNSNQGVEKNNVELSRQRAANVKNYLADVWGIDRARLVEESRNLPEKSANPVTVDGMQENRRVELYSDDLDVTAPVITREFIRVVDPPSIVIESKTVDAEPAEEWIVSASQSNNLIKSYRQSGTDRVVMDWNIESEFMARVPEDRAVDVRVVMKKAGDGDEADSIKVPIELLTTEKKKRLRLADKLIDRFSLFLFEVRSDKISAQNKPIVELIRTSIRPSSTALVVGYTDRLGDAAYNQTLAENRAKRTASELGLSPEKVVVKGLGNSTTFDPDTPEGRLYTRCVDVTIETPVD